MVSMAGSGCEAASAALEGDMNSVVVRVVLVGDITLGQGLGFGCDVALQRIGVLGVGS